ncbi:MAG: adenylosuccinate synthase [Acholeplasmataceae bacterium]
MKNVVIVGTQWGDEGKGKITDFLAQTADVVVRYQGGNNAGHTVIFDNQKYSLHLLPSGILNAKIDNVMANGMVINPKALIEELTKVKDHKLYISNRAHVVLPYHQALDRAYDRANKIGTTNKGIGPAYTDKAARQGLRMADFINPPKFYQFLKETLPIKNKLLTELGEQPFVLETLYNEYKDYAKQIEKYVIDTSQFLNQKIVENKKILFEGAQGVLLCLDHGTYPYVTSSSPTAASVPINTGIAPWLLEGAVGVTKAYTTRVGEGPFPSEIEGELANEIRTVGKEFGTTTGRPRRIGWLDTVVLRHSKRASGLSSLAVTLLDVLTGIDEIKVVKDYTFNGKTIDYIPANIDEFKACKPNYITLKGWQEDITQVKTYADLPANTKIYLKTISEMVDIPISIFSVGADRNQTILIEPIFKED